MTNLPEGARSAYARQLADEAKTLVPGMERLTEIAAELRADDLYRLLGFDTWERFCVDYLGVSKRTANRWIAGPQPKSIGAGQKVAAGQNVPVVESKALNSAKKSEGGERKGKTRSAPLDEPPSDPSSGGAGIQRPQPPTGALLAPLSAPLDPPGSSDPAFQRPLNPPELVGLSDADGLRWMNSRTPQQWRAVGDPYGPGIRAAVRMMGEAFGLRSPGRVIPPGDREAKADAIGGKADPATCKHPKQSRQVLGYMVKCGLCDTKVA